MTPVEFSIRGLPLRALAGPRLLRGQRRVRGGPDQGVPPRPSARTRAACAAGATSQRTTAASTGPSSSRSTAAPEFEGNLSRKLDTKISDVAVQPADAPGAEAEGTNVLAREPRPQLSATAPQRPGRRPQDGHPRADQQADRAQRRFPRLDGEAPLWFYILAESEIKENGARLGAVGGRIITEVFLTQLGDRPRTPTSTPSRAGRRRSSTRASLHHGRLPRPSPACRGRGRGRHTLTQGPTLHRAQGSRSADHSPSTDSTVMMPPPDSSAPDHARAVAESKWLDRGYFPPGSVEYGVA